MQKILTTHVGSLPRTPEVTAVVFAKEKVTIEGKDYGQVSQEKFNQVVEKATLHIIQRQKEVGIDIPSDGEMSKVSYATYIKDRLTGFEGDSPRRTPKDLQEFSSFSQQASASGGTPTYARPQCVAEIKIKNLQPLYEDLEREKKGLTQAKYAKGFMNSASPGVIALFQPSTFHDNHESYLYDLAEAMREEYEAIVAAGLDLQIDSPDLGLGRHMLFADKSEKEFLKMAELHVEVLNHSLRNISGEKIRIHICWGNYEGPHNHDIELKKILPVLLKAKPRQVLFEAANPRHGHEWETWQQAKIPNDYILCPGVIDSTSNFIEHPDLVAQRVKTYAKMVGPERVIASTDCGFATFAGYGKVNEQVVWEKLKSLVKGTHLAQKDL